MPFRFLLTACAALLMLGCATSNPYRSKDLMGGHDRQKGPGKLELITYTSPGNVTSLQAQAFVLFKCAEIANEKQSSWFAIYDSLNGAAQGLATKWPSVGLESDTLVASAFLQLLDTPRKNSFHTESVLEQMRRHIGTEKQQ